MSFRGILDAAAQLLLREAICSPRIFQVPTDGRPVKHTRTGEDGGRSAGLVTASVMVIRLPLTRILIFAYLDQA